MFEDGTLLLSASAPDARDVLAMVARRSYRVRGSRLESVTADPSIDLDWPGEAEGTAAAGRAMLTMDLFAPLKPATDVLLSGSAHCTRGVVRMIETVVKVGPLRKNVRVWGDRTIHLGPAGRPRFSEPHFLESLPLTWEHAYGGRDAYAEAKLQPKKKAFARSEELHGAISYPRNAAGRGFFLDVERERIENTAAPSLEDPEDPVTPDRLLAKSPDDWLDRPVATCYEPVDWLSFPRLAWWLGAEHTAPSRTVYEIRKGALSAEDLQGRALDLPPDPRAYNCAPVGLSGVRLQGNERVTLWNLHRKHEVLEFHLPGERPQMLLEPPGCGIRELTPVLQTVLIEPDQERVTLTWAGTLEVAAPYPEEMCREMRRAVRWH